ncbi:MAG TPA: hypothetical protein VIH76_18150 [Candidatus Acidoferrales bacterium]
MRLSECFLRQLISLVGMFQGLPGKLVAGLMIAFAVVRGGNAMRVGGELVEFGGALVRIVWHVIMKI